MVDIEDVKRLTLAPDDILVVKVDDILTAEMCARVQDQLLRGMGVKNKVMVLDKTTSLAVIEKGSL